MSDDKLYVITPVYSHAGYKSRHKLYKEFKRYIGYFSNVELYTVELAPSKNEFVVTEPNVRNNIQVIGSDPLWYQWNLINIGVSKLPESAKYIAWVDSDVIFTNPNWVSDTISKLNVAPVLQMFSTTIFLDNGYGVLPDCKSAVGIAKALVCDERYHIGNYSEGKDDVGKYNLGRCGLAWACTKEWHTAMGGLFDVCICGSGDTYMSHALINQAESKIDPGMSDGWIKALLLWQQRAQTLNPTDGTIAFIENMVIHYWHGSMKSRGYEHRWQILVNNKYDPYKHLYKDEQGLWCLCEIPECVQLKADLLAYFKSRNEDATAIEEGGY